MTERIPADPAAEIIVSSEQVYQGHWLKVQQDHITLPDGSSGVREYVRHPGAVAVLARLPNGELLLEKQFRSALRRSFIEIPAGKIDPGEAELDCARRELQEETGYQARKWVRLGAADACIGYSDERIVYYFADGLTEGERQLDEGELLEVFSLPLPTVMALAQNGDISDSKTIVGLFWLNAYLARLAK
ncbi:NUDIX domain-containing protein [Parachitinimonas caeni]|uniref:GDP-mannose pyrophosphatase n=1 Tax=Parachitinimonas caeni TaxID=3031301 RepID=A0ABT7DTT8_9NEIS|nr:NUDIX hydrolase [Parachitinimonas caeni]MDK2123446.1 NUDIX hydrolase [Parachitinimonas caeni]